MMIKAKNIFDSISLLNVRIVFLFSAFVHLVVVAFVTLSIDTTVDEDPRVRAYHYIRWKLITCWFNLITLGYIPTRLYCDWRTSQGEGESALVKQLNHACDVVMTGVLFPITLYSDITFWVIFNMDPTVLAPPRIFDVYLPYWAQHSLHTVSAFVVILDLMLTPRSRLRTIKPGLALLYAFSLTYFSMAYSCYLNGEKIYAVFEYWSSSYFVFMTALSMAFLTILFTIQWVAIEVLWRTRHTKKKRLHVR